MTAPYSGASVSQAFRERWLSALMIGDAAPVGKVEIRGGRLVRKYHHFSEFGYPVFGDYPNAFKRGFWYPDWQVNSDWMRLDGIQNIRLEQSFDNNGVQTLTLKMDNKALVAETGAAGILYHLVEGGYYTPLRGYVPPGRPDPGVEQTPFFKKLPNAQIRVKQGYGSDTVVTTFLGLIDDIETDSAPNELTITARDFGGVLVDEHVFGWAKEKDVPSPLTFAPRNVAERRRLVGGGARASSFREGYPPAGATKERGNDWLSAVQSTPADTEWMEITIPKGRYSQIYVDFPFDSQHAYLGINPTSFTDDYGHHKSPQFNGQAMHGFDGDGWWNPNSQTVPGGNGGWAYFFELSSTSSGQGHYITLGGEFEVGDGTVLRLGLRNLGKIKGGYCAGVSYFKANHRKWLRDALVGRYVVIDDVADIVRCCLRWAGFKSWEVEDTGTNLREPYIADPSKSLMDVINEIKDMVGFTFFIGEPKTDGDQDLGTPIFRNNRVFENYTGPTEFIDDSLLLTDAKVKISNADDRCNVRCRGTAVKEGATVDGDLVERIMFTYIPAWAGEDAAKQAGVLKSVVHTDEKFTTLQDCQIGCYLIALAIALNKHTTILDLPGNPGIGLDTLQSVIDRQQGLNSRVYITNRVQEMQFGPDGYWTMELGGALADTPETLSVVKDFRNAVKVIRRGGKNPWRRRRHGRLLQYVGYQDG